jgi:hypothetical protein
VAYLWHLCRPLLSSHPYTQSPPAPAVGFDGLWAVSDIPYKQDTCSEMGIAEKNLNEKVSWMFRIMNKIDEDSN